jgi:hypothetical protein
VESAGSSKIWTKGQYPASHRLPIFILAWWNASESVSNGEFLIMWTTIALLSTFSVIPGQGDLSLTNVRSTHGLLGPQRSSETVSPGDILFVCFDIEGISVDDDGKVRYSTVLEVNDASGKVLFKQAPQKAEAKMSLGGNRVPAYAQISVGLDTTPGDYGYKITVKDLISGNEKSVTRTAKVTAKDFALVRTAVSMDLDGQYPVIVYASGQGIWVNCSAVGFERDRTSKQPNVAFEINVLDEQGKPIHNKPTTNAVNKDVPEQASAVPMAFPLSLNRSGKFTVELLANDQIGGKKAKASFPITVHSAQQEK